MSTSGKSVSACRLCQHYNPEGRRGGFCGKLDVPVIPTWEACSLAAHPFEMSWDPSNDFNSLLHESFHESIPKKNEENIELQDISTRSLSFSEY
ncbi:MAG: hypothetical protein DCF20_13945 [Pseudanabaena sp.]|nr:MAG: hypothetical protein DCF20_13945 [Pseudanabaena sp.]